MTEANSPPNGPMCLNAPGGQQTRHSSIIHYPPPLTALLRLALLDAPAEQAFDRLTRLAAKILHAPAALLSLVDGDRSFFKSSVGLPEHWASRRELPLSNSVCQHVVAANAPLVINDARAHPLVSDNQAVAELRIVAYLGIPLVTSDGQAFGTFAVIDTVCREWTPDDVTTLGDLAASAMTEIELRAATNQRLLVEQRMHLLESVVGNAAAAVLIAEANPAEPSDPRIVFVNDAYTRLTGYTSDEVVGRSHQALTSSETDRSQVDTIRTALATWKPARMELLTRRKDKSAFWAELNIVPIADRAGQYSHWVVIQRDISVQKAAEDALRESESRRQAILESSLDCIITVDNRGQVIEFNPAAERTFGYAKAEVMGKSLAELIVPPVQGDSQTIGLGQYFTADNNSLLEKHLEMTAVRADGTEFPAELAFTVIRPKGPIFTAFLRDITERKRTEEMLKQANQGLETRVAQRTAELSDANEFLKALLENIQDGIVACNAEGVLTLFNRTTREFHGLPERPIRPDQWPEHYGLYRADGQTRMTTAEMPLHRALRGERYQNVEMVIASKGGIPRTLLVSGQAVYGGQGQKLGAVVSMRDITERKRAEAAVRASEERFRAFMDNSPVAAWITDTDGRVLYVSATYRSTFLQPPGDLIGKSAFDLYAPEIARVLVNNILQVARTMQILETNEQALRADGTPAEFLVYKFPLPWEGGGVVVGGIAVDVTERVRTQHALHREQEFLRAVLESVEEAVVACDAEGNFTLVNKATHALREPGLEPFRVQQWIQNFTLFEADGKTPMAQEDFPLARALRGERVHNVELVLAPRQGPKRTLLATGQPLVDARGNNLGAVIALHDVTQRRSLEAQFIQSQKMEVVGQLAAGVAHDFNNLIQVITGCAELVLVDLAEDSPARELVQQMNKAGERAAALTRQLLAFSRKQILAPALLNLNEIVRDVEKMLKRLIGLDISLAVTLQPDLALVLADASQLEQVLMNLAVNARDAMPRGGKLTIETKNVDLDEDYVRARAEVRQGRHVLLAVSDTGTGMTAEVQARLFEPFFTTKEKGKGTGLGLATVFGIVKQSGGHVAAYSEPGHGTTFKVYLPRVQGPVQPRKAFSGRVAADSGHETLLLVEDDDAVRAFIRLILKGAGYSLLEATNGEEALRAAGEHQGIIHLLVSDVVLPGLGGRPLAERLLALRPEMKVLYLSGYTDDAVVRHGILEAEVNFLQKPFRRAELTCKVREVLDALP